MVIFQILKRIYVLLLIKAEKYDIFIEKLLNLAL